MSAKRIACPACGIDNSESAKKCRLCGAAIGTIKPKYESLRGTDFHAAARYNRRMTTILFATLMLILAGFGYLVGWAIEVWQWEAEHKEAISTIWFLSESGFVGVMIAWLTGAIWILVALKFGDQIVLKINQGNEAFVDDERQLHNVVEEMAIAAGVPKPRIYIVESEAMNAFATGMRREKSAIGVTRGLLNNLNRDELQGVIAHEMGHILNLDIRYATAVGVVVGLIVLLSDIALRFLFCGGGRTRGRGRGNGGAGVIVLILLVFAILSPLAAKVIQMAVSRQREFLADATSVRLTRNPHGLISALKKLSKGS